jgi:hypothetical protein
MRDSIRGGSMREHRRSVTWRSVVFGLGLVVALVAVLRWQPPAVSGQQQNPLAQPFVGVTTDGTVESGLFAIRSTGVSTGPVRTAALAFLHALTPDQREATTFAADDIEWRDWNNVHRAARKGVSFREMNETQRELAFAMMAAGLSAKGLQKSRNVMRLNGHLAELVNNFEEYGEFLYWITVMGEPSDTEPWGWQLDGHHLVINYFVLGDQVVMTPTFMGSEPVIAESGQFAGTRVMQDEQQRGLALAQSLTPEQRAVAVIRADKPGNNALSQAFRDNLVLDYAGLPASRLNETQRTLLLDLIGEYVGNMAEGHARVRMDEVRRHLDRTTFAWIGDIGPDAVFYYRIHSPVILIEFDHQSPIALGRRGDPPSRRHVHSVVRTPNGNDYGKDILRQHYEAHRNDPAHGHRH